ncbi:hypothetical protein B0H13DRAFT_2251640 [Mycena leptocephala]|nr:hypothetical protein B0H13DRAFT_2251640 [Mycena leptocephala]
MDLTKFAARLDIVASGLLETISPDILDGQNFDTEKVLRAEMYKLNVYGPGGHFKGHKDTPRGEDMIGSLVGGALTLSHDDKNWIFDSAGELAMRPATVGPAIAYVEFYSDVTHAVEPVLEGHRVTLTYNLFLVDRPLAARLPAAGHRILQGPAQLLEDTLLALLADSAFLPTGGLLAFGLTHQYPMPSLPRPNKPRPTALALGPVLRLLKGSDARLRTAAQRVGLATHVKILYDSGEHERDGDGIGHDILTEDVLNMENMSQEYGDLTDEIDRRGALLQRGEQRMQDIEAIDRKKHGGTRSRRYWHESGGAEFEGAIPVHWVTRITELNRVRSQYVAYGNESTLSHMYGNAALFVQVPALGEGVRSTE